MFKNLDFILRGCIRHSQSPANNLQAANFGQITSTRFAVSDGGSSRQLQISVKFVF